jgi:pyrroloquinoline quinone biosynthesis protein D
VTSDRPEGELGDGLTGAGAALAGMALWGAKPRLARKVRLKFDPIDAQFLILYPERGLKLSDSAAEILQRCDGERTTHAIAEELALASNAPLDVLRRDVTAFLEEMRRRGIVEFG